VVETPSRFSEKRPPFFSHVVVPVVFADHYPQRILKSFQYFVSRGKLFYRLLHQAVQVDPVPYKNIVGGKVNPNGTEAGGVN